ncbi:MAG: aldo/keto reductase [Sneathiella sp.]|uniref:aldo/keto reductase n=1 Tax=Sneathiella sp. TaxID=1964365 RepID=UPI0030012F17
MRTRQIGEFSVSSIGFGCMNLSFGYGNVPDSVYGAKLLHEALDAGYTMLDTAALYGNGANETLIGEALKSRRNDYMLASKCGISKNEEGVRTINGKPSEIRKVCEESLKLLQTDVIDLYYLHRLDFTIPIEESVGALSDLVSEGKIRTIGLSEMSAETIRRAHAVHPVSAVQSEYSLWTRNPEIAVLDACKDIGAAFVAFSPLARAFLTGTLQDPQGLPTGDLRHGMPRFETDNYQKNLDLLEEYANLAEESNCSMAQLALAWLLAKHDYIIPIPGTKNIEHMRENAKSDGISLSEDVVKCLDQLINQQTVHGSRYDAAAQSKIDTEEFA